MTKYYAHVVSTDDADFALIITNKSISNKYDVYAIPDKLVTEIMLTIMTAQNQQLGLYK